MTKVATVQAQQKWDYCSASRRTENTLVAAVNELGQSGWELVSVIQHKDGKGELLWTGFLKRPGLGQTPAPGSQTAAIAKPAPVGQAKEAATPLQGFDLSGDEFAVKTD